MSEVSETSPLPAATLDELIPLVFDELRQLARRQLAREHQIQTLQTTDLVHEAYLRLANLCRDHPRNSECAAHTASASPRVSNQT